MIQLFGRRAYYEGGGGLSMLFRVSQHLGSIVEAEPTHRRHRSTRANDSLTGKDCRKAIAENAP